MSHYTVVSQRGAEMQVKEAVQRASQYLPEIFESAAGRDLTLEGVEKTDDSLFWKITFSYYENGGEHAAARHILSGLKTYKTVKIRDSNGEFMGAQDGMRLAPL